MILAKRGHWIHITKNRNDDYERQALLVRLQEMLNIAGIKFDSSGSLSYRIRAHKE